MEGAGRMGSGPAGWGLPEVSPLLKNICNETSSNHCRKIDEYSLACHESSFSTLLFFSWNRSHIDFRSSAFTSDPTLCPSCRGNYSQNRSRGFAHMRPVAHQEKRLSHKFNIMVFFIHKVFTSKL